VSVDDRQATEDDPASCPRPYSSIAGLAPGDATLRTLQGRCNGLAVTGHPVGRSPFSTLEHSDPHEGDPMRRIAVAPALAAAALALTVGTAFADVGGPNTTTGTADCGSAGMFTFVVGGNNGMGKATTWMPAFVTSMTTGARFLFVPSELNLTFTTPAGSMTSDEVKGNAPGPVTCTIASTPNPQFSLSGTVKGRLVARGG
jgi:hypothetical protein